MRHIYPCPVASQKPAFLLIEMVRPGGFELPAFWFVGKQSKILSAASGVAYRGRAIYSVLNWTEELDMK